MDIVSRIKEYMAHKGLAISQFADTCTIPRPTVSQLLNGRNKKVSDEVIGKIHSAYPDLSISWLMFGEGEMLVASNSGPNGLNAADNQKFPSGGQNLFNDENVGTLNSPDFAPHNHVTDYDTAVNQRQQPAAQISQYDLQKIFMQVSAAQSAQKGTQAVKKVSNIVVFYSDNSFEFFGPSSPAVTPAQ